jgi:hypothetical protein
VSVFESPQPLFCLMASQGEGHLPGGFGSVDIPEACGVGEWDLRRVPAGSGGQGDLVKVHDGLAGAVRISKPGFY